MSHLPDLFLWDLSDHTGGPTLTSSPRGPCPGPLSWAFLRAHTYLITDLRRSPTGHLHKWAGV